MTEETPHSTPHTERTIPKFFVEWRDRLGPDARDWSPIDFINQESAVPFVMAARWLFCPDFFEYRDCVFVVKNTAPSTNDPHLTEHDKAIIDDWFRVLRNDRAAVESKTNLLNVAALFASVDIAPFENDLLGLARSIAECWQGLLMVRFPDRRFTVEVYDDGSDSGPELTFHSEHRTRVEPVPNLRRWFI